jgi:hypothetical protein
LLSEQSGVIHVMTALSAAPRRTNMKTFTIDPENSISVFATPEQAAAATTTPFDSFASQKQLVELAAGWPAKQSDPDRAFLIHQNGAGCRGRKSLSFSN